MSLIGIPFIIIGLIFIIFPKVIALRWKAGGQIGGISYGSRGPPLYTIWGVERAILITRITGIFFALVGLYGLFML